MAGSAQLCFWTRWLRQLPQSSAPSFQEPKQHLLQRRYPVPSFDQSPALVCKNPNCSQPMLLPPARRHGTSQDQVSWPRDGGPRNFLCPVCKHVYEYSPQDVRQLKFDETDRGRDRKRHSVACIEFSCGAGDCAAQVRIRTLVAFDVDPAAEAHLLLVLSTFHEIPCGGGHLLSGTYRPGSFDAYFDEDWQTEGV